MIVPSPAKGQPFEMQASAINVIGWVDDPDTYPIQPKSHSLEFLREVAHLRPRRMKSTPPPGVRGRLAKSSVDTRNSAPLAGKACTMAFALLGSIRDLSKPTVTSP